MAKRTLLIIFGGQSSEHEVSLMSARNVFAAVDTDIYKTTLVSITKSGEWYRVDAVRDAGSQDDVVSLDLATKQFIVNGEAFRPDVVFPVLHGKYGEDGTIQELLEMLQLPYVGCGVLASSLAMDKMRSKQVVEHSNLGIKTAPWIMLARGQNWREELYKYTSPHATNNNTLSKKLGDGPWFVKPSRSGSSVGVSKVMQIHSLETAVEEAFQFDDIALIERAIDGHEVEVAVMGDAGRVTISRPGVVVPGEEFYSYEDKYANDSRSRTSVSLPEHIASTHDTVRRCAGEIYQAIGCSGLARVDFFVTDDLQVYFNEINTMPGFTDISMYPKLMEGVGYSYRQLVDKLLELALE